MLDLNKKYRIYGILTADELNQVFYIIIKNVQ